MGTEFANKFVKKVANELVMSKLNDKGHLLGNRLGKEILKV
jgi:hypothetical protein